MLGVHNQHLLKILHKHPPLEAGYSPCTFDLLNITRRPDLIPLFDIMINKSHLSMINILTATSSNCVSCARIGGNASIILGQQLAADLMRTAFHRTSRITRALLNTSVPSPKNTAMGSYINQHFMRGKTVVSLCVYGKTTNSDNI